MMGRGASCRSDNSDEGNNKMFMDYINDSSPEIINEFNCSKNLNDDLMDEENPLFHN
jgi:hypothetical protein